VGTPEDVALEPSSHTGQYLKRVLAAGARATAPARRRATRG
jgi:hypothetical protein